MDMGCRSSFYKNKLTQQAWRSIPPAKQPNLSEVLQVFIQDFATEGGFWEPPGELPEES